MALPQGPREPASVQMLEWVFRPAEFLVRCAKQFGDQFSMKVPIYGSFWVVSDPATVKEIFTGDNSVLWAGKGNRILEPIVGSNSVLLLDGQEHMRQRKLLLPPFHGERMQAYAGLMKDITLRSIQKWPLMTPFAVHRFTQQITLDVILRAVFGLSEGAEMNQFSALLTEFFTPPPFIMSFIPFMQKDLPQSPMRKFLRLRDKVDAELFRIIRERRTSSQEGRTDILSLLLAARHENDEPMSDQELRDELVTLLAAGHETTATALSWALRYVLQNPPVQTTLKKEIRTVCEGAFDENKLKELPYLDAVTKEVLRLQPVVPIVVRETQAPITIGGREIPKGVLVAPCAYLTHRRPDLYVDPLMFRPERFLNKKIDPYEWFPFGGGIRRCIGMAFAQFELAIVLATIIDSTDLRLVRPGEVKTTRRSVTLAPQDGTQVIRW